MFEHDFTDAVTNTNNGDTTFSIMTFCITAQSKNNTNVAPDAYAECHCVKCHLCWVFTLSCHNADCHFV